MECERCFNGEQAKYRAYTDIIDMKVCPVCADKARKVGIAVEVIGGEGKNNSTRNEPALKDRRLDSAINTANNGG
jgi:hypothetical protein